MNAKIFNIDGSECGSAQLPESVFGAEVNKALLHSVITGYLAAQRQGTAKTKGRSEVSGGGRKPFKQKGTGRARAGSNTSPVWVRGGKAHGTNPRDYRQAITKKMRRGALASAFSVRAAEENVVVLDKVELSEPKTSIMANFMAKAGFSDSKTLILIPAGEQNLYLSSRNIKDVNVKVCTDVTAYDVLNAKTVLFVTEDSISKVEEVVTK